MKRTVMMMACLLACGWACAQDSDAFQAEIAEKSGGLETAQGGIPGTVLVAGKPAFPLAVGRVGKVPVPVAAGTVLGKGRVVALGHELFLPPEALLKPCNAAFLQAALIWLSGGTNPKTVCYDAKSGAFQGTAAAIHGTQIKAIERLDQLEEIALPAVFLILPESWGVAEMGKVKAFIERGGGVIATAVGWGWHQVSGGKSFKTQSAFNALLGPAGLYMDGNGVEPMEGKRFTDCRHAPAVIDGAKALELAEGHENQKGDEAQQATFLIEAFRKVLPDDETRYRPRIEAVIGDLNRAAVPSPKQPIRSGQVGDRLALCAFQDRWLRDPVKVWPAHPAAKVYPGVPAADTPRVTRSVWVDLTVPRWHGTGLFAVAGEPLTVTLPEGAEREGLRLRIGSTTCRVTAHEKWLRAPVVDIEIPLNKRETTLSSPFGGLVYVTVPNGKKGKIQVKVGPACPAPWFVEGRDSAEGWRQTIRNLPPRQKQLKTQVMKKRKKAEFLLRKP